MTLITVIVAVTIIAVLWAGIKPFIKRGLYRDYAIYAVMMLWSIYLFASQWYDWPPFTIISIMTLMLAPIKRFLNIMSWMR